MAQRVRPPVSRVPLPIYHGAPDSHTRDPLRIADCVVHPHVPLVQAPWHAPRLVRRGSASKVANPQPSKISSTGIPYTPELSFATDSTCICSAIPRQPYLSGRRPKYFHLSLFPRWRAHVHLPVPDVNPRYMATQRPKLLPFALPRTPRSRYFSFAHSPLLSSAELPAWQIVGFSSGGEPESTPRRADSGRGSRPGFTRLCGGSR